jgi:hypothetical protein
MRWHRRWLSFSLLAAGAACGSRTGLLAEVEPDAELPPEDAELPEAGVDAPVDRAPDAPDAAGRDVTAKDVLPPIDVTPPVEAASHCPDAAATLVYLITTSTNLYSFLPSAGLFSHIGTIQCPAKPGFTPFSMAVSRTGTAYVVYDDGELFRVSTATAACSATPFGNAPTGFGPTFGMAFSRDAVGGGETLYVAGDGSPPQLGRIDVTTFAFTIVGDFQPSITEAELTGTGAGDLFGFWASSTASDSAIVQIDKATARITASTPLPALSLGRGWAFAFWGGDFYTFTAPSTTLTVVHRYRPSDGSLVQVAQLGEEVVGAGVSTCAPQ